MFLWNERCCVKNCFDHWKAHLLPTAGANLVGIKGDVVIRPDGVGCGGPVLCAPRIILDECM